MADFWDTITNLGSKGYKYITDTDSGLLADFGDAFKKSDGTYDWGKIIGGGTGVAAALGILPKSLTDANIQRTGYTGGIPDLTAVRSRVPNTYDATRVPGSGGQRYFTDTRYVAPEGIAGAQVAAGEQLDELKALNAANLARKLRPVPPATPTTPSRNYFDPIAYPVMPDPTSLMAKKYNLTDAELKAIKEGKPLDTYTTTSGANTTPNSGIAAGYPENTTLNPARPGQPVPMSKGGITSLNIGGQPPSNVGGGLPSRYLNTTEDGMADTIPAVIDGQDPARLAGGEFVVAADVVSGLGNGNSDAGAKELYDMMDRIRQARTGTTKQGKQINPQQIMPV